MFGLFKKKSPLEQLYKKHKALLAEAHRLSTINRTQADEKMAEADIVLQEIERLESKTNSIELKRI